MCTHFQLCRAADVLMHIPTLKINMLADRQQWHSHTTRDTQLCSELRHASINLHNPNQHSYNNRITSRACSTDAVDIAHNPLCSPSARIVVHTQTHVTGQNQAFGLTMCTPFRPENMRARLHLVSSPDPTHKVGKGLVTLLTFLGCAESAFT